MIGRGTKIFACTLAAVLILVQACANGTPYTKDTFVMGTKAWVTIAGMRKSDSSFT